MTKSVTLAMKRRQIKKNWKMIDKLLRSGHSVTAVRKLPKARY